MSKAAALGVVLAVLAVVLIAFHGLRGSDINDSSSEERQAASHLGLDVPADAAISSAEASLVHLGTDPVPTVSGTASVTKLSRFGGGDPERYLVVERPEGSGVSVEASIDVLQNEFHNLIDALLHDGAGIANYGIYQATLTDFPEFQSGDVTLSQIACGEILCAAAMTSYSTDALESVRTELFRRMWQDDSSVPKMHGTMFYDVHTVAGTERRMIFFVKPMPGGSVHDPGARVVSVIQGPSTKNEAAEGNVDP